MKKRVSGWSAKLFLTKDEAIDICNLGNPKKQCPYLVPHLSEFECVREDYPNNTEIIERLKDKNESMNNNTCDWYMVAATAREI